MSASRCVAALLAAALLLGRPAAAAQVIAVAEVSAHVGGPVTVEGDVADARVDSGSLILEMAPQDPKGFRVVLVLALISDLPRHPERLYAGKRIRTTGIIQRFRGRPEMIVESPSQIEVIDVAGAGPTVTTPAAAGTTTTTLPEVAPAAAVPAGVEVRPAPEAAAPVPARPPPPASPAAPAHEAPAPPPGPTATVPAPPASAPAAEKPLLMERIAAELCERARARWRDAADEVRTQSAALARCLAATTYRCREAAAALAPALTNLEWAEQLVDARCD